MKKIFITLSVILLAVVAYVANSHNASALSGPTGLNEIRTESGPGVGQVTLNWRRYHTDVENYSILYGTTSGKYMYGANKIGNIVSYTIGGLTPGVRYYFRLYPYRGGQIVNPMSAEVSEVAASAPMTIIGTAGPYGRNLLTAVTGPKSGQVHLKWKRFFQETEKYHIVYGLKPGQYIYGALNAVDTTPGDDWYDYVIGGLTPGVRYYFALMPQIGGKPIYTTAEVSQIASY